MRVVVLATIIVLAGSSAALAQQGGRQFYPSVAQQQGIGGRAVLECVVGENGRLACQAVEESPPGMAFGAAAVRMSEYWRVAPETHDGVPTAGGRIRRELVFEPGPPARVVSPSTIDGLVWEAQPDARDFARLYPREARRRGVSGMATMDCVVDQSYGLDCVITAETPAGMGFAEATLSIAREFRVASQTSSGESTVGQRVRRTIRWVMN